MSGFHVIVDGAYVWQAYKNSNADTHGSKGIDMHHLISYFFDPSDVATITVVDGDPSHYLTQVAQASPQENATFRSRQEWHLSMKSAGIHVDTVKFKLQNQNWAQCGADPLIGAQLTWKTAEESNVCLIAGDADFQASVEFVRHKCRKNQKLAICGFEFSFSRELRSLQGLGVLVYLMPAGRIEKVASYRRNAGPIQPWMHAPFPNPMHGGGNGGAVALRGGGGVGFDRHGGSDAGSGGGAMDPSLCPAPSSAVDPSLVGVGGGGMRGGGGGGWKRGGTPPRGRDLNDQLAPRMNSRDGTGRAQASPATAYGGVAAGRGGRGGQNFGHVGGGGDMLRGGSAPLGSMVTSRPIGRKFVAHENVGTLTLEPPLPGQFTYGTETPELFMKQVISSNIRGRNHRVSNACWVIELPPDAPFTIICGDTTSAREYSGDDGRCFIVVYGVDPRPNEMHPSVELTPHIAPQPIPRQRVMPSDNECRGLASHAFNLVAGKDFGHVPLTVIGVRAPQSSILVRPSRLKSSQGSQVVDCGEATILLFFHEFFRCHPLK